VKSGSIYQLRVFQYVPEPGPDDETIPAHDLDLVAFPDHVIALRPKLQAVGKYDRLNFDIKVLDLAPGERTAIAIPDVPDAATTRSASITLYLPLKVADSGRVAAIAAVVICQPLLHLLAARRFASSGRGKKRRHDHLRADRRRTVAGA